MTGFVALLRGINVGGNNQIRMPELADCFRGGGFENVSTYIQSGNVIFSATPQPALDLESNLEALIEAQFGLSIMVVVRSRDELQSIVAEAPNTHGSAEYRSDVFFLKDPGAVNETFAALPELRDGVDEVAKGPGVIYFSRLDAEASRSRMTKFIGTAPYKRTTIRNWRTTTKLMELLG